ncbi:MAG TPA: hypothetical protein VFR60_02945 [Sphingomicrobium sp.]|nr:hypothetical protein [Sphingomicrobium sp.]
MLTMLAAAALATSSPILHYIRSNRDGSEPEHVVQFRTSRTGIAVYKWVEKCTTAAYVTAEMSDDVRQGRVFFAGKVAKDGRQTRFGILTADPGLMILAADVVPPGGKRIRERHSLRAIPFLIYDFDFADLNSFLQEHRPKTDFAFALPVIWPSDEAIFRDLGMLRAHYAGPEQHLGRDVLRFDLTVDGPTPSTGTLWVDAADRFIVDAELGIPNHMEYKDFRLKLDKIEPGSQMAWGALVKSQYANCPPPPPKP